MEQNMTLFILTQKQKQLLIKAMLTMNLDLLILQLCQKYKKLLGIGLGWITDSVIDQNIYILKCNSSAGSSYIKLPKELDHPKKVFD